MVLGKIACNLCICEYTNIDFSFLLKIVALILSQLIKFMQDFYLLRGVSQIHRDNFVNCYKKSFISSNGLSILTRSLLVTCK